MERIAWLARHLDLAVLWLADPAGDLPAELRPEFRARLVELRAWLAQQGAPNDMSNEQRQEDGA